MTGEMHSIIVRAGIKALLKLSKEERKELLGGYEFDPEYFQWISDHPTFRSKEEDNMFDLVRRILDTPEMQERLKNLK